MGGRFPLRRAEKAARGQRERLPDPELDRPSTLPSEASLCEATAWPQGLDLAPAALTTRSAQPKPSSETPPPCAFLSEATAGGGGVGVRGTGLRGGGRRGPPDALLQGEAAPADETPTPRPSLPSCASRGLAGLSRRGARGPGPSPHPGPPPLTSTNSHPPSQAPAGHGSAVTWSQSAASPSSPNPRPPQDGPPGLPAPVRGPGNTKPCPAHPLAKKLLRGC